MISSVPLIRVGRYLLVSVPEDLDDDSIEALEDAIARKVSGMGAQGVLLDVSGLAIVDSFVARVIARIASIVQLLGAPTVLVGIQPAVAITLVELGLFLEGVPTALDTTLGIRLLQRLATQVDGR